MKVILSGGTGYIGSAVLKRLIVDARITSIAALSRRELPFKDAKVQTIILKDFLHYDDTILQQLHGAEACLWCFGKATSGEAVHMDMTMAAVNAFETAVLPTLSPGQKFTFVYLSGHLAEKDQNKSMWILGGARKMRIRRGEVENKVVAVRQKRPDTWRSYVARPSLVTNGEPFLSFALGGMYIPVEELAAALVDVAIAGYEKERIENGELREVGKKALSKA